MSCETEVKTEVIDDGAYERPKRIRKKVDLEAKFGQQNAVLKRKRKYTSKIMYCIKCKKEIIIRWATKSRKKSSRSKSKDYICVNCLTLAKQKKIKLLAKKTAAVESFVSTEIVIKEVSLGQPVLDDQKRVRKKVNLEEKFKALEVLTPAKRSTLICRTCKISKKVVFTRKGERKRYTRYECIKCQENKELEMLKEKRRLKRVKDFDYTCDLCGFTCNYRERIFIHMDSHLEVKCAVCCKVFASRASLRYHLKSYFEDFICHLCGLTFKVERHFNTHVAEHDPNYVRKPKDNKNLDKNDSKEEFKCEFCPRVFDKKLLLYSHQNYWHKNGETRDPSRCKAVGCDKTFYSAEELRLHSFEHYKGKVRFCDFPDCKRFFRGGKLLTVHKRTHFPPKFTCSECGSKFIQRSALSKHKRRTKCKELQESLVRDAAERLRKAGIAKAQFVDLGGRLADNVETMVKTKTENVDTKSIVKKAETNEIIDIMAVYIKEEPNDDWQYDFVNESQAEIPALNPFVLLTRLEPDELRRWTRVEEEESPVKPKVSQSLQPQKKPKLNTTRELSTSKPKQLHFPSGSNFECDFCAELFQKRTLLRIHLQQHLKDLRSKIRWHCKFPLCERNFKTQLVLDKHERNCRYGIFESDGSTKFMCDICGKTCSLWIKMHLHLRTHFESREKPKAVFICEICQKVFSSKSLLIKHTQRVHDVQRRWVCHVCAKAFFSSYELESHLKTHNVKEECRLCGLMTRNMEKHLRNHMQPKKKILAPCPVCGKIMNKCMVKAHIERIHEKVSNGRIFSCDKCGERFMRNYDLRKHNYTNHFQGVLKSCNECDAVFRNQKALTVHRQVHNPGNIKCEVCGNTYKRKTALSKHKRMKHPELIDREKVNDNE